MPTHTEDGATRNKLQQFQRQTDRHRQTDILTVETELRDACLHMSRFTQSERFGTVENISHI
jgi:hypothetical protein